MKLSIMIPYSISKKILHREHKMHQKLQLEQKVVKQAETHKRLSFCITILIR